MYEIGTAPATPGKAAVAARAIVAAIHRETRMLGPPENPIRLTARIAPAGFGKLKAI
jgi:hypothetical protein